MPPNFNCQTCGACCVYWDVHLSPGDTTERLFPHLVKQTLIGKVMRVRSGHCIALGGRVGRNVRCRIYADRPIVCEEFPVGGHHCLESRRRLGLQVNPP